MRPDAGRIVIDGVDVTGITGRAFDRVRERYGVVFQGGALFDSMTCAGNVAFPLREKTRLPRAEIAARVARGLEQVGLGDVGDKYPAEVSGGMRKRVAIARALVTEPAVVFFDEPTTGLDPILVNTIHGLIGELHRRGQTIVLTTHYMEEADQLCQRVAIIDHGRLLALDTPSGLKDAVGAETELRTAEANLQALQAQVRQQQVQLRYFTIAAPTNWQQSTSGYQTYLTDPADSNTNVLVTTLSRNARSWLTRKRVPV